MNSQKPYRECQGHVVGNTWLTGDTGAWLTVAQRGCVPWLTGDYRVYRCCVQRLTGVPRGCHGKHRG